ncbi:hypothetical protein [Streptomyces sp. NBC_01237]|uniref:hypothetical protein n=1 Tax=Streptomyces sp. NBC_01237 TaxID=2903790 RepID=UPI002DD8947F|nr:hypothetical protein [Streptomyces sp. NBC_01237]WRZ73793.1 hypothetical protein OG251_20345 [Streptomyces sp. NBC_01237]
MDTHAVQGAAHQATGHYRRPGTRTLYCGRPAGPRNRLFCTVRGWKVCRSCVNAEARDRVDAEAVAAEHTAEQPAAVAPAPARPRRALPVRTYVYGAQQLTIIGTPRPAQGALFAAR